MRYGGHGRWPVVAVVAAAVLILSGGIYAMHRQSTPVREAGQELGYVAPKPEHFTFAMFVGDSWTDGSASSQALRWSSLVAHQLGWTEENLGQPGTGYVTSETGTDHTDYPDKVTRLRRAGTPKYIVVSGGFNDVKQAGHPAMLDAGIASTYRAIRAKYPHAVVFAVAPFWPDNQPPPILTRMAADVRAAAKSIGAHYYDPAGIFATHPDLIWQTGHYIHHPNDRGNAYLADELVAAMYATGTV